MSSFTNGVNAEDRLTRHARCLVRTIVAIWLIILVRTPLVAFALVPIDPSESPGVTGILFRMGLADHLFRSGALELIRLVACASLLAGGVTLRPAWLLTATGSVILLDGATKAMGGYVNHAQAIPLQALIIVTVVSASRLSVSVKARAAVGLVAAALVLSYSYTGIERVVQSGPAVFDAAGTFRTVHLAAHEYSAYGFDVGCSCVADMTCGMALRFGFIIVTLVECGSASVLLGRGWRRAWALLMVGFHLSSVLLMNILFWENVVLLVVLFLWPRADAFWAMHPAQGRE